MDFYLVFKDNRHQILIDPSDKDMENVEIIFRALAIEPPTNRGYLRLLPAAAADMITRSQKEIFLPNRISEFNRMTNDITFSLPLEIQSHWNVFIRLGLSSLLITAPTNPDAS